MFVPDIMGTLRLLIGIAIGALILTSVFNSYYYYNKRNIFNDVLKGKGKTLLFLLPSFHKNIKGKFWARVHLLTWLIVIVVLAFGLIFSR